MINIQRVKTIILFVLISLVFLFTPILGINLAAAACVAGQPGPHSGGGNGGLTGRPCSAIRNSDGSITGPGQFGHDYDCRGACIYAVTYCTGDSCEEVYTQRDCATAPTACNNPNTAPQSDIAKVFGQITPPLPIQNLGFGSAGISKFFTNLVRLIYILATIVLVFMLIWGAWDWMTSEGDKEKLQSAQRKILNAIIGIILFAAAFAVLQVLGTFTGFKFFT